MNWLTDYYHEKLSSLFGATITALLPWSSMAEKVIVGTLTGCLVYTFTRFGSWLLQKVFKAVKGAE